MKHLIFLLQWLVVFGGVIGCAGTDTSLEGNLKTVIRADWAQEEYWDDGLAEVATYAAERVIYNRSRNFEWVQITVKEDFNKAYRVKTDNYQRDDLYPVMKVNQFCRIETENYPYHFLTSLFFRRENPVNLHKLTTSSQEWCGNTFKSLVWKGGDYVIAYNSYWDGQGTGEMKLDHELLFEDQLSYTLRALKFQDGLTFKHPVAGLLQTNKADKPAIYPATFQVQPERDPKGQLLWKVTVVLSPNQQNVYWFEQQYPHVMVQQKTWDGRNMVLKQVSRSAYWQH